MNRDCSGAAEQPLTGGSSKNYMVSALLIGSSLVFFLLAAVVDWLTGSEASRLVYGASAFLTLTAVGLMCWGIVLSLRLRDRLLRIGALIGGLLAISGLLLEFTFFFFGGILVESRASSLLTRALLVLEYPGELLCDLLGIALDRHAYDVPPDRLLFEWPIVGVANLLGWCMLGVVVGWVGNKALTLIRQ